MAFPKVKKSVKNPGDIELIKSDIASFASSIGLSSTLPSSGFNDSDFRKTGPIESSNPSKKSRQKNPKEIQKPSTDRNRNEQPVPKPPVLSLDDEEEEKKSKGFDRFKNLPKLPLMKASSLGVWYEEVVELEVKVIGEGNGRVDVKNVEEWKRVVEKKRELGERLMAQYVVDYGSTKGQSGDIKMVMKSQRSGTAADKVSAFSVMVGDNPIANMRSLDALLGMVTSKVGKRHALTGFDVLKELFILSLLPDRKLKTLLQRPVNKLPDSKDGYSLLLLWYWEECLKQRFERFVIALEEASRDMLALLKDKALKIMYALLENKSEQERRLLSALVNKLGDPQHKGASNAEFHLTNLLSKHPNMKVVVIDEVDSFLFRPHLGLRAKYHAVNFLSQIRLSNKGDGPKVAKRLIDVYFGLFKVLITEAGGNRKTDKGSSAGDVKAVGSFKDGKLNEPLESHVELDSRILSALLTGVNRAFPFVSSNEVDDIIEVQTPMLFQLVHSKNFNIGVQALMLLDKISSKNHIVSDRFYRALYSKLLLPAAMNSSKAEMFIGLILRAMKSDINLKRVSAFSKRLLQVALQQPPQYACGCLFLLSEVLKARPPLWNMVIQNESVDEDIEHFEDIVEDADTPVLQKESVDEDLEHFEDIVEEAGEEPNSQLIQKESNDDADSGNDSSGDEDISQSSHSEDVSDAEEDLLFREGSKEVLESNRISDHSGPGVQVPSSKKSLLPGGYNPRYREPSYCNADRASWWELMVLASHVHPSVATMARTLLSGANIIYNGNPLNDLSLPAFLDKLMEKKPKSNTWHSGSQIKDDNKLNMNNHLIGPEILSLAEVDVPPEDFVFHKFYMNKMNTTKKPKKKKKKRVDDEDEDVEELVGVDGGDDDSDNEEIDNVLDSANRALEADGDYDYDDLDEIANKDDDDLVVDTSDAELDAPSDLGEGAEFDAVAGEYMSEDEDAVDIGDADDGSDDEDVFDQPKGKRKSSRTAASPFASLEDYEHLLKEDGSASKEPRQKKKRLGERKKTKSQKKSKLSN